MEEIIWIGYWRINDEGKDLVSKLLASGRDDVVRYQNRRMEQPRYALRNGSAPASLYQANPLRSGFWT